MGAYYKRYAPNGTMVMLHLLCRNGILFSGKRNATSREELKSMTTIILIIALIAIIVFFAYDTVYGTLTRRGFEFIWLIFQLLARLGLFDLVFMDLDNMHSLNDELGYAEVDRRIRESCRLRRTDLMLSARWYSGDEILFMCQRGTGLGMADRVKRRLADNGLSATFGVTGLSSNLLLSVSRASDAVQNAKRDNNRGSITHV